MSPQKPHFKHYRRNEGSITEVHHSLLHQDGRMGPLQHVNRPESKCQQLCMRGNEDASQELRCQTCHKMYLKVT